MNILAKLLLLLASISALPLAVTVVVVLQQQKAVQGELDTKNEEIGRTTSEESARALRTQAEATHQQIVREKAARLGGYFEDIRRAVLLQATLVEQCLLADPSGRALPIYSADRVEELLEADDPAFKVDHGKTPYVTYDLAPGVAYDEVAGTLSRLSQLGYSYMHNHGELPWCISTYLGHEDGFILGYPGRTRYPEGFDPRTKPWYTRASAAGHLIWTNLYVDRDGSTPVYTCAVPVYRPGGEKPVAVVAIDVKLAEVLNDLFDLPGIEVSDALLVDGVGDDSLVIVSRTYATEEAGPTPQLEKVASFAGGSYQEVFREFRSRLEAGDHSMASSPMRSSLGGPVPVRRPVSGIVALGDQPGGAEMSDGALFAYAEITIEEGDQGKGKKWYYVAKTPIDHIAKPVTAIRDGILAKNSEMKEEIDGSFRELAVIILAIIGGVLVLALLVACVGANSATRALVTMSEVAQKIGEGNLDQHVQIRSRDEIGRLGGAINRMIEGLKERDFIKQTFKHFVAPAVVEEILEDPDKLELGGEKRQLTVFFSDIAGFTNVSEQLEPEVLVTLINEYLTAMADAILRHEGTIDKYVGDSIVAFWGAPLDQDEHALRACRAALDNVKALEPLRLGWEQRGLPGLDVRIGVHTGPMVVGMMGSEQKLNYTVMGDSVNLGSRLEGANKAYGTRIMISEATREAAGANIEVRELDALAVKGRTQGVRVHELLGMAGEVPDEQRAGCRRYEEGLAAYRAGRWDEAEAALHGALSILGQDGPSSVLLERVAAFRTAPPPRDWDGVFSMAMK